MELNASTLGLMDIRPAAAFRHITNTGRMIAVDSMSGKWLLVGAVKSHRLPGVEWSIETTNGGYEVMKDGTITKEVKNSLVGVGNVVKF